MVLPAERVAVETLRARRRGWATRTDERACMPAGASVAMSTHLQPVELRSEADLPALQAAPYGAHLTFLRQFALSFET